LNKSASHQNQTWPLFGTMCKQFEYISKRKLESLSGNTNFNALFFLNKGP